MNIRKPYTIRRVQEKDSSQVTRFMMRIRKEIFPMLSPDQLPPDLLHFNEYYVEQEGAAVYAAFFEDEEVIGTIGICPYDGRFARLQEFYEQKKTAEIVKCYIDSQYRRLGIGSVLFTEAVSFCKDAGYEQLYLHTHPFLPNAIPFWKAKGFEERWAEDDPVWNTLHMDMKV